MRRFYVEQLREGSAEAIIRGDELRHLKVLRLDKGDEVALFNGMGLDAEGVILSITRARAVVTIHSTVPASAESPLDIILLAAITKWDKPDLVVQKATELGVSSIIFYYAGRSVRLARSARTAEKVLRWRRIAIGAVKQCGRSVVPEIACKRELASAMSYVDNAGVKLFFYEGGGSSLGEVTKKLQGLRPKSLALLIGPEGGFTDDECEMALRAGYKVCGLGPRILRAETAAIAAMTLAQHLFGDI